MSGIEFTKENALQYSMKKHGFVVYPKDDDHETGFYFPDTGLFQFPTQHPYPPKDSEGKSEPIPDEKLKFAQWYTRYDDKNDQFTYTVEESTYKDGNYKRPRCALSGNQFYFPRRKVINPQGQEVWKTTGDVYSWWHSSAGDWAVNNLYGNSIGSIASWLSPYYTVIYNKTLCYYRLNEDRDPVIQQCPNVIYRNGQSWKAVSGSAVISGFCLKDVMIEEDGKSQRKTFALICRTELSTLAITIEVYEVGSGLELKQQTTLLEGSEDFNRLFSWPCRFNRDHSQFAVLGMIMEDDESVLTKITGSIEISKTGEITINHELTHYVIQETIHIDATPAPTKQQSYTFVGYYLDYTLDNVRYYRSTSSGGGQTEIHSFVAPFVLTYNKDDELIEGTMRSVTYSTITSSYYNSTVDFNDHIYNDGTDNGQNIDFSNNNEYRPSVVQQKKIEWVIGLTTIETFFNIESNGIELDHGEFIDNSVNYTHSIREGTRNRTEERATAYDIQHVHFDYIDLNNECIVYREERQAYTENTESTYEYYYEDSKFNDYGDLVTATYGYSKTFDDRFDYALKVFAHGEPLLIATLNQTSSELSTNNQSSSQNKESYPYTELITVETKVQKNYQGSSQCYEETKTGSGYDNTDSELLVKLIYYGHDTKGTLDLEFNNTLISSSSSADLLDTRSRSSVKTPPLLTTAQVRSLANEVCFEYNKRIFYPDLGLFTWLPRWVYDLHEAFEDWPGQGSSASSDTHLYSITGIFGENLRPNQYVYNLSEDNQDYSVVQQIAFSIDPRFENLSKQHPWLFSVWHHVISLNNIVRLDFNKNLTNEQSVVDVADIEFKPITNPPKDFSEFKSDTLTLNPIGLY